MVACYPMNPTVPTISSLRLSEILGISYRRLDYACRFSAALRAKNTGSGTRRRFTEDEARRLLVAAQLTSAVMAGTGSQTIWPNAVVSCMEGPPPPESGFALLRPDGDVAYTSTLTADDFDTGPVGGLVRYDLAEALTDAEGEPVFAAA